MLIKEIIQRKIYDFKGHKIMFDFDLSEMYDVEARTLKQAVRRNINRFPGDFLIRLSREEWKELITTCDNLPETVKYSPVPPFAFTEQGIAMLSTISWKRIKEIKSFRIESELVSGKTISTNEN